MRGFVNCKYNDSAWCLNKIVPRQRILGIIPAARCCIEYGTRNKCSVAERYPAPPPPPYLQKQT